MPQKQRRRAPREPEGEPELLVTTAQMRQELTDRIDQGHKLLEPTSKGVTSIEPLRAEFYTWDEYNEKLLAKRFATTQVAIKYRRVVAGFGDSSNLAKQLEWLVKDANRQIRKLESIRFQLDLFEPTAPMPPMPRAAASRLRAALSQPSFGNRIFIVHGHDGDTKLQVADFIERITGDRPIILHEQADSGRTVIEKFEAHAGEAGFAIILLTGDDEGRKKGAAALNLRARQNVVLEFGYFMAKLGRSRVVAIHEPDVELPSDVLGILYKSLAGNWKFELAREIQAAGIEIDLAQALR